MNVWIKKLQKRGLVRVGERCLPLEPDYTAALVPTATKQLRLLLFKRCRLIRTARFSGRSAAIACARQWARAHKKTREEVYAKTG